MKTRTAIVLILFLSFAGCGKKGTPSPPVPSIPKATTDLAVAQQGPATVLSWSFPALTTAGKSLEDLREITVLRYVETLPVSVLEQQRAAETALESPDAPRPIALFELVPTLVPQQFAKLATPVASIDHEDLPRHTNGARLVFTDIPPLVGDGGLPVRLTYGVVTRGEKTRSNLSNIVTLVPLDVPIAPEAPVAEARTSEVSLRWHAPAKSVTGNSDPPVSGYNVYRFAASGPMDPSAAKINTAPVIDTAFEDAPPYGTYRYSIAAVSAFGPPPVQSALSDPATVTFEDRVAPPPPPTISALVEETAIRTLWEPVEASDLKGYRIYRTSADGSKNLLTPEPVGELTYRDGTVQPGSVYRYWVSSVDGNGNESEATPSEPVLFPR